MEDFKIELGEKFKNQYGDAATRFFISPGRLEIVGNHTDHNCGFALVSSASMYIKCAVRPTETNIVRLYSEGHDAYKVVAVKSEPNSSLYSTTDSLLNGVITGFLKRGYKVGGFDAYCTSEVPAGSGVSSSAAFECLICSIFNELFNDGKVETIELVKIAQEAESLFFGKPCGLLDQIGAAFGGISFVDFKDSKSPIVKNTQFPFDLKIVLTNPGGSHAGLNDYYASIPNDMHHVAEALGYRNLRESSKNELDQFINDYPNVLSEIEINRAIHFFQECERVKTAYSAINDKHAATFIDAINGSGNSSSTLLNNTQVPGRYENSPERALTIAREVAPLSGHRVHGGGFMGTIISFVRKEDYSNFIQVMKENFGENNVIDVSISPFGASEIK